MRAGRAPGQWQPFGLRVEDAAGVGPPEHRVREQDEDGLDAEVLFPAMVAGPALWRNISHDDPYKAMIRAYNDWLAEEYCPVAPDRLTFRQGSRQARKAHSSRRAAVFVTLGAAANCRQERIPPSPLFEGEMGDLTTPSSPRSL